MNAKEAIEKVIDAAKCLVDCSLDSRINLYPKAYGIVNKGLNKAISEASRFLRESIGEGSKEAGK